jgi:hypothetical protein
LAARQASSSSLYKTVVPGESASACCNVPLPPFTTAPLRVTLLALRIEANFTKPK